MDGPGDYHTNQSVSERGRQIPYDITYRWNLNYGTGDHIYESKANSQIENRLVVAKHGAEGGPRERRGAWD